MWQGYKEQYYDVIVLFFPEKIVSLGQKLDRLLIFSRKVFHYIWSGRSEIVYI